MKNKTTQEIKFKQEFEKLTNLKLTGLVEISKADLWSIYLPIVKKLNKKYGNGITSPLCIMNQSGHNYIEYKTKYFKA